MEFKEHLKKKLEEWREILEEAKELDRDRYFLGKANGSFFAYKEMLDFMINNDDIAVVGKRASGEISSLTAMLNVIESGDLDSEQLIMLKDHIIGRLLQLANNT